MKDGYSDIEVIDIDRKEDRVIGDDIDDASSDGGGGGFLKSSDSSKPRKEDGVIGDDSGDDGSDGGGFLKNSDSPSAKPSSHQELGNDEDKDDDESESEDDAVTIDKGTIVAKDTGDNITMYGIVKDCLDYDKYKDDESVEKWIVEYRYKDGLKCTQRNKTELLDDDSILSAYNYFRNLPDERKEIGYAMFGLMEFDVVFETEILGFTYCNDKKIGKVVVQSSKSHHINVDDILVSAGGESVFAKTFDQVDQILKRHKERPIAIRFRRSVPTIITEGKR